MTGRGEAVVERHLIFDRNVAVSQARIDGLFAAYLDHVHRWQSIPDGLAQTMMRQALGAAALHLSTRPRDETVAWTLNIKTPPLNLFFTGHTAERTVTGRVYTEGVKTVDVSRLFVESSRARHPAARSTIDVVGLDVLQIFEQYYARSEQTVARFFELSEMHLIGVIGLPDVDEDWMHGLTRTDARALLGDGARPIDAQVFRFHCGCEPARMLEVVRALYRGDADALFLGESGVETFCPRCGRRWWIDREEF